MSSFVAFENICSVQEKHLSDAAAQAIPGLIENGLLCLNALSAEALRNRSFFWQCLPKAHMTTHMAYDMAASGRNPRSLTCYPDEDMIGRVKVIVESCHGKTYAENTLRRYAILVGIRWWSLLEALRFG